MGKSDYIQEKSNIKPEIMFNGEIIGNLGRDAEVKTSKNGKNFLTFTVAHTEKHGETEETTWISCIYYNEKVASYLTKGKKVYISGSLSVRVYNDKPDITCNVATLVLC
uniref:single-stranded DNA-binding protein n=1 Tax=Bacteroides fragilis TaxID=817 RepID=UPI003562C3C6